MGTTATPRTASLATWSLIFAIIGLVLFGPFGSIPAIVCGHLAISKISRSSGMLTGRGLAIAGLVIGYIGFALQLLIITAILLPALSGAREGSRRALCANHLSQIGKGAILYSDSNNKYPPDFKSLNKYLNDPKIFVCPATGHDAGDMSKVDQWADYVLVPNIQVTADGDAVLAFSKPECYPNKGGNILFVNGSVRWCPLEEYRKLTAVRTR